MKKVLTYGTFDLLHEGHINILKSAKKFGDYLVVGLSTDEFNELKNKKAFDSFAKRKEELLKTGLVDLVIPEDNWEQKIDDIKTNDIDVFVMGSDWNGKFDFLSEYCEVYYLEESDGVFSMAKKNKKILEEKEVSEEIISILSTSNDELDEKSLISLFENNSKYKVEYVFDSLSNIVIKIHNFIIKYNLGGEFGKNKIRIEYEYLKQKNKICFITKNALIIKYEEGKVISKNDFDNFEVIDKIIDQSNQLRNTKLEFEVPKQNLVDKYIKKRNEISNEISNLGLDISLLDDAIKTYSEMKMSLIHSDLNEGNILLHKNEIKFIDFGNLSYHQWIYEYVVLISNWDIEKKHIDYILEKIECKMEFCDIWPLILVYLVDILIWNKNKLSSLNSRNNYEKILKIERRILFLEKFI